MDVQVNPEISLLMETADLVFACVNQRDLSTLTSDGPYCIPSHEVQRIMDAVCGDLDMEDWRVKFYFRGYFMEHYKHSVADLSCVGCLLIYTSLATNDCDLTKSRAMMHDHSVGRPGYYQINSFNSFAIGVQVSEHYRPVWEELNALDMPEGLRMQLLEALSNYHYHVDQLCDFLEPLAQKLLPLLQPWWENAQPRLVQWREFLETEDGKQRILGDVNLNLKDLQNLRVSFRLLLTSYNRCKYIVQKSKFYCSMGIEAKLMPEEKECLAPLETMALRLLSSTDRVEMLRIMSHQTVMPREITKELGINPGTVFRDINNLAQAHLITEVVDGVRRSYTTNLEYLKQFLRRLYHYIERGSKP